MTDYKDVQIDIKQVTKPCISNRNDLGYKCICTYLGIRCDLVFFFLNVLVPRLVTKILAMT